MMATKQRRTKGQDKDTYSDSNSDSDDKTTTRRQYVSSVERKHRQKIKETRKKLRTLCDSEGDSDVEEKENDRARPFMTAVPYPTFTKYCKRMPNKKRKRLNSITESKSESSSSAEFENKHLKPNNPISKLKNSKNKHLLDDYADVSTPTKSDDENIVVDKEQDLSFKNYVKEEIKKVEDMLDELKNDLEVQKEFFINKKVNVVRDTKFIAHKILSLYDETHHKIKGNRDKFVNHYKTWMNTCSKSAKLSRKKKNNSLTKCNNEEKTDKLSNKYDKEKINYKKQPNNMRKSKSSDESDKNECSSKKDEKIYNNKSDSDESCMSLDNTIGSKSSSQSDKKETALEKGKTHGEKIDCSQKQKRVKKSTLQKNKSIDSHESDKNTSASEDSQPNKNVEKKNESFSNSSELNSVQNKSLESRESVGNTSLSENSQHNKNVEKKNKSFSNSSEINSVQNKSLESRESDGNTALSENSQHNKIVERNNESSSNSSELNSVKNKSVGTPESGDNTSASQGSQNNKNVEKKNESFSNSSELNSVKNKSLGTSESGDNTSASEDLQHSKNLEKNSKSSSNSSVPNSIKNKFVGNHESNKMKNINNVDEIEKNDSAGQVSDCDSDEIFSADENRSKKKNQKEKIYIDKYSEEEDLEESEKVTSQQHNSSINSSQDLFDSSTSEIANTPIKSPILCSKNKSLRKTMLKTSKINEKSISNESEINSDKDKVKLNSDTDDSELKAFNNLKEDCDSDISTICVERNNVLNTDSDNSQKSYCSTVVIKRSQSNSQSPKKKSNNVIKKKKRFIMQTKKNHSICSDSSSDSAEECNRRNNSRLVKDDALTRRKRRQETFNIRKNRHYKADKKLRMVCRVTLERLSQIVLEKYSRALEKSKNNVENKKINSITNLEGLEGKKKSKKKVEALESSLSDNACTSTRSKKKKKNEKVSVVEHVNEENDILSECDISDKAYDNDQMEDIINDMSVEQEIVIEGENKVKEDLLKGCSSSDNDDMIAVPETNECPRKSKRSKSKKIKKDHSLEDECNEKNGDEELSDENSITKKEKSSWKNDKVLNFKVTDTESEEEKFIKSQEKKKTQNEEENDISLEEEESFTEKSNKKKECSKKKKKSRKLKRVLDSDTDQQSCSGDEKENDSNDELESVGEEEDEEEEQEEEDEEEEGEGEEDEERSKKKKKSKKRKAASDSDTSSSEKKPKTKRKRIKKVTSDSDSDLDSPNKGRKNIRKVLKDKHVADDTKKAALDEEERLKRIAERQRLFNAMYDAKLAGEAKVEKLVLDFDEETKEELVVVDNELVKRLKPHQAQGIKFMWDACFESLNQIEKSEGSGCIIAHCMGLGKSFQVVTLAHTLLSHEETGVKTVMVVCPLSTVLNWVNEFKTWLKHVKNCDEIDVYELTKAKKNIERKYQLECWKKGGGVLIIGYEMFRNLTSTGRKMRKAMQESIMRSLVDPGADLVVCDEGHLLKNEDSALSKAMKLVKTLRRVVLTGTPLQNNLKEYHCMVQFVKPNLLGTKKEFLNRFVNPITNGQFDDSTPYDVKLMKKRAHVLHKMLEGSVQRFDYSVLTPFLPPKQEYVIFVRLTEVQIKMYQHYIDNFARRFGQRNGSLFADFQELQRIWTHPYVLRLNAEKVDKANEKKRLEASDSEGSLKDFIDDDSESESIHSSSSAESNSDVQCVESDHEKPVRNTRSSRAMKDEPEEAAPHQETTEELAWWSKFLEENHFLDLRISTKLILLFGILKESEQIGDKVLVFSQSLYSLTLIEHFLSLIDQESQNDVEAEHLDNHTGNWGLGLDYFRLDGSTSAENRSAWCKIFNNPNNTRARLFLISTRAGGLGINLTAANRVIIFDASWNPSHDVQSIFRIYRFGQRKPCYVYRFLAAGTMEEKIYNRQVTKLSLACRVVDEQQIERHYSNNDLAELYQFESYEGKSLTLNLPKDRLLAEIFLKYKDAVYTYHEHDSLLENKQEEELDEEERKQAWLEYEEEKQGKRQIVNTGNNMLFNQMMMNINSYPEFESMKLLIQKDYPNLPPEHLDTVARQAMYDMYRFVDQQSVNQLLNPFASGQAMQSQNMLGASAMQQMQQQYNQQSQLLNMLNQPQMNYPGVNHMQAYSGRGRPPKHIAMNNPMSNVLQMQAAMQMPMRAPIQGPMQTPMQTPLQTPMQTPLQSSLQTPTQTAIQVQQTQSAVGNNDSIEILSEKQRAQANSDSTSNISDKKKK